MTLPQSLAAFFIAAGLLTVTPGLDTMLVLRTAASEGRTAALLAAGGIQLGCLAWGGAVALGLGALLTASAAAYAALTWCGAAYLVWIGVTLLWAPRRMLDVGTDVAVAAGHDRHRWLWRGFLTNLLNPKIGVFYVSFLPQFVPVGYVPAPFMFGLAVGHVLLASAWLSLLTPRYEPPRPAVAPAGRHRLARSNDGRGLRRLRHEARVVARRVTRAVRRRAVTRLTGRLPMTPVRDRVAPDGRTCRR